MEIKQWATNYSQCIKCNKTDKPHKALHHQFWLGAVM